MLSQLMLNVPSGLTYSMHITRCGAWQRACSTGRRVSDVPAHKEGALIVADHCQSQRWSKHAFFAQAHPEQRIPWEAHTTKATAT